MKILPSTKDEWIGFVFLPFKVYVVAALPLFLIFTTFASTRLDGRWSGSDVRTGVYLGYLLCIAVLVFGTVVQAGICQRGAAARTILFVGCAIVFLLLLWRV